MTDSVLSRFVGGTLYTSLGQITTVVLGMLSLMVTARWISTEDLGAYFLLVAIAQLVYMISSLGVNTSITKHLTNIYDNKIKNELISTTIYFQFLVLSVFVVLVLFFKEILFTIFGASLYAELIIYLPILLLVDGVLRLLSSIYEGLLKFKLISLAAIVGSISSFISILIFVVWLDLGVQGRVFALLLSKITAIIIPFLFAQIKLKLVFDLTMLQKILRFGFPLYINQILSFIFIRIDTMLIGALLGPAEIAVYEIAKKIPDSLTMLYDAFRKVYFPIISKVHAKGKIKQTATLLNNSNRLLAFLGVLGTIIIYAFGNEIVSLIFSTKYLESVPTFTVLMLALTLSTIDETLGYSLVAIGSPDKPPIINTIRATVSLIGYILLIPTIGIIGAALANLIGTVIVNPLNVYFLKRKNINVKFSVFVKPIIIFGIISAIFFIVRPNNFLTKSLIIIAFVVFSKIFSVFTLNDINTLTQEIINFATQYRKKLAQS